MTISDFNKLPDTEFLNTISVCLGSEKWQKEMLKQRPFKDLAHIFQVSNQIWYTQCNEDDLLSAFQHHPVIGDRKSIEEKFSSTKEFAGREQSAVADAEPGLLHELASANKQYLEKNGFIFIVYATGKSAAEMYRLLKSRMNHTRKEELVIAMGEQQKITQTRLRKILADEDSKAVKISQLTTHVLDTSIGKPAKNILVTLKKNNADVPQIISEGLTNEDGRISNLLPDEHLLEKGEYSLIFNTIPYFRENGIDSFYPFIEINFSINTSDHYHVPLLLNPYGYSTYRGS